MATAYVKGLQGNDPRYVRASAGCKHFAVYAGPENVPTSRMSFDVKVCTVIVNSTGIASCGALGHVPPPLPTV